MTVAGRPAVSVIVVTFNSSAVIRDCLVDLAEPDHEVIVIDNCSSDDTVRIVTDEFPQIRVIQNKENVGFSRAVNEAAAASKGANLLLLNPDASINSTTVARLAAELDQDASIGAIAPLLGHEGTGIRVIAAGRAPTIWRMFLHQSGLSRLGTKSSFFEGNYLFRNNFSKTPKDVDWASGGCLMVPASTWVALGGLTDRWFMYAEDVDFCLRVRSSGQRVVVDPRLNAAHAVGGSSATVDGRVNTMWIENLYDLYSWRIAPTRLHAGIWKTVMLSGMLAREMTYRYTGRIFSQRRLEARANARRYVVYRKALSGVKSVSTRSSESYRLGGFASGA
ncbi:glycosyltransferase family 2 protein [Cryobacterium sp. TMT4-31]|uniref:glycosyltransferase family 2 protein n=1 Tax=Cryobacterium sp. TMT4-31 TaxID=1259259 RepID=UPI00141AAB10|nr:glycosyltransferase family 2 protein [Cryobacterium sp. TMT4-31]